LNKGGNDFDGLTSEGSSIFIRGPTDNAKIMDESSYAGSVMQKADNDDDGSFMGVVDDRDKDLDNGSAFYDGDKGLSKVQTDS